MWSAPKNNRMRVITVFSCIPFMERKCIGGKEMHFIIPYVECGFLAVSVMLPSNNELHETRVNKGILILKSIVVTIVTKF